MDECQVVRGRLVEARSESAKTLQVVEEDLDQITLAIRLAVESGLVASARTWMNDCLHPSSFDASSNRVRIVSRVSYERFALRMLRDDFFRDRRFVLLSGRELDVERAAFRVDERVELGRKPSS